MIDWAFEYIVQSFRKYSNLNIVRFVTHFMGFRFYNKISSHCENRRLSLFQQWWKHPVFVVPAKQQLHDYTVQHSIILLETRCMTLQPTRTQWISDGTDYQGSFRKVLLHFIIGRLIEGPITPGGSNTICRHYGFNSEKSGGPSSNS